MKYCCILFAGLVLGAKAAEFPPKIAYRFASERGLVYEISPAELQSGARRWINAQVAGQKQPVQLGSEIILRLAPGKSPNSLIAGRRLVQRRVIAPGFYLFQADDAGSALDLAREISLQKDVIECRPVMRQFPRLHGPYARKPNDPFFDRQFYLEQRNSNGIPVGADLNLRGAWPFSQGQGVIIGVADDGIEQTHPELQLRTSGMPHFNFIQGTTDGSPSTSFDRHATAVAGLIAAEASNGEGISGVAPLARMASWKIFDEGNPDPFLQFPDEIQMMDMFQYRTDSVGVQNHSWGFGGTQHLGPSPSELIGISNAVSIGRAGLGVVMVRSAGNDRINGGNADDDGYTLDPRVITVAAVRSDGRAAKYSNPGACILVGAPSGEVHDDGFSPDLNFPTLFTTDRQGFEGYDQSSDYCGDATGFSGTSGAAPQVSGIAALILSVNTNLSYRDVQQVILQSSRHVDWNDPGIQTNGAGFAVSHNVGFGIPDAAVAVDLARRWVPRPALAEFTFPTNLSLAIPDDGLRVLITGANIPASLQSIGATPGWGLHPDAPTAVLPIVDVGLATNALATNLTGKAALIQRGVNFFTEKIQLAANAGAAFAVVYNNRDATERILMGNTDFSPIPAVFISQNDGEALRNFLQQSNATAQLKLSSADVSWAMTNTMLCEQVGLRLKTDHSRRADVRVTLTSPSGTRSVLQRLNYDTNSAGPVDWTYYSTQYFYESSAGTWRLSVSDESPGRTGSITMAALILRGTPIKDADRDGLDDDWEMANFGSLASGPLADPDGDGYNNIREQVLGTDPNAVDLEFRVDLSPWDARLARLSWPASTNYLYEIRGGASVTNLQVLTNLPGRFPQTEWLTPYNSSAQRFFKALRISP